MIEKENESFLWRSDIRAAEELCYPESVVEALKREPNKFKRSRILTNARKEAYC